MSAYTDKAAILSQIQMADLIACCDDDSTGSLNDEVLNSVISAASGYIDRKVSNIYSTPFTGSIPVAVQSMALTISAWMLYRRRLAPGEKNNFDSDYKDVVEMLNKVNQGEMMLETGEERIYSQVATAGRFSIYGPGNVLSNSM